MAIWDDAFGLAGDAFDAIGGGVKSVADLGKNTNRVTPFSQDKNYNPNAFQYGGREGYADEAANRYAGLAAQAQGRGASLANYGQADQYAGMGLGARGQQQQVADMMMARAQGLVPSIAGMQASQDMQRAMAAQTSMAASARGAGGLALAQQQAANGIAGAQGQIAGQAMVAAAQERLASENAALGGFAGLRAGDVASQQQAAGQAQYQATQQAQQRAQNDQYGAQLMQNEMGVRQQALQGQIQQQQTLANNSLGAQQQQANIGQANADRDWGQARMIMGGGQAAADTRTQQGLGSDDQMKMGLTPLGNVGLVPATPQMQPIRAVEEDNGPSWKQSAQSSLMGPGMLTGLSAQRVQQIQNPTGQINSFDSGGHSGFLSDDRAKNAVARQAFIAGAQAATQGAPQDYERMGHGQRMYASQLDGEGEDSITVRDGIAPPPTDQQPERLNPRVRKYYEDQERSGGDMTAQLATGLAPYAYEYKPGMGPPGAQVGPRAQLMASQPATATAVTTRPDGLMQIDPAGGTKTALAGVGQLAQDMQSVKAYIASLQKGRR